MAGQTKTGPLDYEKSYYQTNDYTPTHITADISENEIKTIGGKHNSRMMLTVVNETNQEIRGFFTQNVTNDIQSIFKSRFQAKAHSKDYEPLLPIYEHLRSFKTREMSMRSFRAVDLTNTI